MANTEENPETETTTTEPDSPDVHFEPIVKLSLVETKTLEENEDILLQLRARLFRLDSESDPKEWKERGVGECRILKHKETGYIRILMRRDKTLKICANHYIKPDMELKPNCGSDRAWLWSTSADFADEESKEEVLAIKFGNADNAQKFKSVFEESKKAMKNIREEKSTEAKNETKATNGEKEENSKEQETTENSQEGDSDDRPEADQLSGQLKELSVKEG